MRGRPRLRTWCRLVGGCPFQACSARASRGRKLIGEKTDGAGGRRANEVYQWLPLPTDPNWGRAVDDRRKRSLNYGPVIKSGSMRGMIAVWLPGPF